MVLVTEILTNLQMQVSRPSFLTGVVHPFLMFLCMLAGFSTLVVSFLARVRGSNNPELSITRVKDLEQFICECQALEMDYGHVIGDKYDSELIHFQNRFEELLGNANEYVLHRPEVLFNSQALSQRAAVFPSCMILFPYNEDPTDIIQYSLDLGLTWYVTRSSFLSVVTRKFVGILIKSVSNAVWSHHSSRLNIAKVPALGPNFHT